MMLTDAQLAIVHTAAIEYAVAHYKDDPQPKASVLLAAGEEFAEGLPVSVNVNGTDMHNAYCDRFVRKVNEALLFLRNEKPPRVYR